jgi:hypothetical protein
VNRRTIINQLNQEIERNLPSLGAWQALGLALMVVGLVSEGRSQLSRIAEGIAEAGSYNTVRQRLKRWLSNPRLQVSRVCEEWISWLWRSYGGRCW